jgi:hypothetical protein
VAHLYDLKADRTDVSIEEKKERVGS